MIHFGIEKFTIGTQVLCIQEDYEGLIGSIDEVRSGEDKESENEGLYDIYVDFEEVEGMNQKYPHLNGTGVGGLIMDIEDLAIVENVIEGTAVDVYGKEYLLKDYIK